MAPWPTMELIDDILEIRVPFDDADELARMAAGFSYYSRGNMNHSVMAIDGWVWVCRTRQPYPLSLNFRTTSSYNLLALSLSG